MATARRPAVNRGSRPAPRPPEGTPPPSELARQARAGLTGAVAIAHWAAAEHGAPGALSDEAAARATEALGVSEREVRSDWDRARLIGLIEHHAGTTRPGWRLQAWDRDDSAVLRGWVALLDAWSLACPAPETAEPTAVAEVVEAVPQLLSLLQLSAGPVQISALLDMLRQRVAELRTERCEVPQEATESREPADGAGGAASADDTKDAEDAATLEGLLDWALDALSSVGALTVLEEPKDGPGGPESAGGGPDDAKGDRREAELTALGNWAVWVKLEQICVAAQSPAGNIEQHAPDMLRGCAGLTPGPARAEYRAWLAARPVGSAVVELIDAARGDDALLRGLAFEALRVVGAPAEPNVRAVVDESCLRPYALLWLAEHEGADPDEALDALTREEATWLWVDTAAAISDHGESPLLVRHLESAVQGTVPALLAEVRAVGHPRTVQVLVALAAAHPDPALAKAVRRAAFQVHTGGA
ncbi:hypothetical protein NP777_12470 [Streptomyces sp. RCU064]|uniref:Uncharacterized protein n=2 Tax=Streptomyces rugosispiralis TaxID=2967341 RepID=A0ABT1UXJ6_9ACTN|nr:hypothetical protein [Streptomyces rugosispiralis]MCQ8189061.1 hypothetical protein [Streptomyces rugosispiralis]